MEITTPIILTIIYLNRRTHIETTRYRFTKSWNECVQQARATRRSVLVGKVKLFCGGKQI